MYLSSCTMLRNKDKNTEFFGVFMCGGPDDSNLELFNYLVNNLEELKKFNESIKFMLSEGYKEPLLHVVY